MKVFRLLRGFFIFILVHKRFECAQLLNIDSAQKLRVRSERSFAVSFLSYFGGDIPLVHHPLTVSVDGVGSTELDFGTPFKLKGRLLYEVTEYTNVYNVPEKQRQFIVMECYAQLYPEIHHLMINGINLNRPLETMQILSGVYYDDLKIPVAQKKLNNMT